MRGQSLPDFENSKPDSDVVRQLEDHGISTENDRRLAQFVMHNRILNTLRSFESIAAHLAGVPGRKNLIWVSGSFPLLVSMRDMRSPVPNMVRVFDMDERSYLAELERTMRTLNQANVALYPVDARGLMAPPVRMDQRGATPVAAATAAENIETMTIIADRTGGKAYYNRNDLDVAVREVFDESELTYTLGYYTDAPDFDGKWRDIQVVVNRPGVTVRHRRGYFALAEQKTDEATMKSELRAAVWSPVDATGIGVNARVARSGDMWNVMLQIDPATVTFTRADNRWTGRLDVAVVAQSTEGKNVDATFDTIGMNLKRDTYESAIRSGILFETRLRYRPDAAALKVAVRDAPSGLTGTLTIPASRIATDTGHHSR